MSMISLNHRNQSIRTTRGLLAAAVCAACGLGAAGPLRAADTPPGDSAASVSTDITPGFTLHPNYGLAKSAARTPLMSLFDDIGIGQTLDNLGIRIYGHAEGSVTHNFDNPHAAGGVENFGRVFDLENNRGQLNQLSFNIERLVDPSRKQLDIGGRVEVLYGTDASFIHATGLLDSRNFFTGPANQFDLTQAYLDIAVPVGDGLLIRAGKFVYFKQLDPNASVFYSHSFTFGAALPFTLTGIYGSYKLGDKLTLDGGFSRGWDNATKDNNGAIDGFGRIKYQFNDKTSLSAAVISGPEQNHDNSHYRTVIDTTLTTAVSDSLTLLADAVYGYEARPDSGTTTNSTAQWYGVSCYAVDKISEQFSVAGRVEWYADNGGYTTGLNQNLYEVTVGSTITPFPNSGVGHNFKLRPEFRWDYSSQRYFSNLSSHDQFTFAIDAIYNF